jgi:5-deoxy-glucuronate isomerase
MPTASHHGFPPEPGLHELTSDLEHLRFALARVSGDGDGDAVTLNTGAHEALVVVIEAPSGALVSVAGRDFSLPPRGSVFADGPSAVYAPPGSELRLSGELLAGIFQARVEDGAAELDAYAILPEEVASVERGRGNFARRVRDILPATRPAARLLAGETLNPPGNWSSSPPHKHDRDIPGQEAELEEIYLFRVDPPQGFGLQMSYSTDPPQESAFAVHDLDAVSIPAGYHPVVAAPGYDLYYLWCLAGHGRELLWNPDPAHAWVDGG